MPYAISYVPSAAKAIRKLDRPAAHRLLDAIEGLASEPRLAGCITLKEGGGELRIRVGDYRVVYDVQDDELVILVLRSGIAETCIDEATSVVSRSRLRLLA